MSGGSSGGSSDGDAAAVGSGRTRGVSGGSAIGAAGVVARAFVDAVRMETWRMVTVRSGYIISGLAVFGGVVVALVTALMAPDNIDLTPGRTVSALTVGGEAVPMSPIGGLLAVLGALSVGQDYRYRLLSAVFTAVPRRTVVVLARLAVLGAAAFGVAMTVSLFGALACVVLGRSPSHDRETLRVVGTYLLLCVLWTWLGAGLTWVIRSGAGAVSVLLLGPLLVEPLILLLGTVGSPELRHVLNWLPFAAARQALGPLHGPPPTIGAFAAAVEFTAVTLAVVVAGGVLVRRRGA